MQPLADTLFKISYHYKVSKKDIQIVNKFSGDDIFMFKELLVPYSGNAESCDIEPMPSDKLTEKEE